MCCPVNLCKWTTIISFCMSGGAGRPTLPSVNELLRLADVSKVDVTQLTHYPAPHQNYKATRSCKTSLPPDLGVKQAKGLTDAEIMKAYEVLRTRYLKPDLRQDLKDFKLDRLTTFELYMDNAKPATRKVWAKLLVEIVGIFNDVAQSLKLEEPTAKKFL